MGLDCTKAFYKLRNIRDIQIEHSINETILERNSMILTGPWTLRQDYDKVTDELCYAPGMVLFMYSNWNGVIRAVQGHVCSVEIGTVSKDVKIWTEKHEMVLITLYCVKDVSVTQLEPDMV